MHVFLDDLTKDEFKKRADENVLVFLPIGAVEEHGPHLPLGTDSMQAEVLVQRLADHFDAIIAPPVRYGECSTTRNFPGTITLTFDTLRSLAREILQELARNEIRNIVVLSGHAGRAHMIALREAGKEVVTQYPDLKLMILSDYEIAYDLLGTWVDKDDGHSGTIETSRILHIDENKVKGRPEKATLRPPKFRIMTNPETCFPTGVWGDPTKASKELGKKIEDHIYDKLVELIQEMLEE
jgi:creatinine amidohydrolase